MLVMNLVDAASPSPRRQMPGDIVAGGENILGGALTTVGNGTWLGAMIATGIIYRTGPVGGYTDTTDTAANILNAIAANNWSAEGVPGSTFRLLVVNSVAQAMTFAAGTGVVTGTGVLNIAASTWREYLITVLSFQPPVILQCGTTNGSAVVTLYLPNPGQPSINLGPNQKVLPIYQNASVTGTGIPNGTTIQGINFGNGGIIGFTLSANATATNANVALTLGPTIQIDGLRSGTL